MRSFTVILLIVLTVGVTSVICKQKFRQQPDEMDRYESTITGLDKVLPKETAFSVELIHARLEYMLYTRYYMEPRHVYFPDISTDTVFVINDNHDADSVMNHVVNNKKILWQNRDNQYTYTLVCSK